MTIARMYNIEAAKVNSTMSAGFALLSIDPKDGTPATALGPRMGIEATSLSRILKNLEEKNLITREKSDIDKRSVIVKLTDEGLRMRDYSKAVVLLLDQKIRAEIPETELSQLLKTLKKIQQIAEEIKH